MCASQCHGRNLILKTTPLVGWSDADKEHLGQELSDVLVYLIRLADRCHVDLPTAVLNKIALNEKKYPADKVRGSSQKYTAYLEKEQNKMED